MKQAIFLFSPSKNTIQNILPPTTHTRQKQVYFAQSNNPLTAYLLPLY
ncbi:hypothetical protein CYK57_00657 [Actinobacillus pleuropneumoniae]|nr:hypothetical protein CYK57_00657 [Actinobacillus pleuropneumoniae]